MSITSFTELTNAITRYLARDDLGSNIPDFIALFEAEANRRLRLRQQEAGTGIATTLGIGILPSDYLSWREVFVYTGNAAGQPLEYITPSVRDGLYFNNPQGTPTAFTIVGSTIQVFPYDDSKVIGFSYWQRIPLLAAGPNFLIFDAPDLYLFGSLYHAYDFMLDLQNAAFRKAQRDELFESLQMSSNKTRGVGGMRVLGPTP